MFKIFKFVEPNFLLFTKSDNNTMFIPDRQKYTYYFDYHGILRYYCTQSIKSYLDALFNGVSYIDHYQNNIDNTVVLSRQNSNVAEHKSNTSDLNQNSYTCIQYTNINDLSTSHCKYENYFVEHDFSRKKKKTKKKSKKKGKLSNSKKPNNKKYRDERDRLNIDCSDLFYIEDLNYAHILGAGCDSDSDSDCLCYCYCSCKNSDYDDCYYW